jgi:hypothetical protein
MRTRIPFALLATALACSLGTAPAHARARVFVASYGDDANPCTFGSPCKTFQHAHDVVDAGGEVTAIDSAGFGPINITKSVSITSPAGVEAGIVSTSGAEGITINAGPNDAIHLQGLIIDGGGVGDAGIAFSPGAGLLDIRECVVRNFVNDGIVFQQAGHPATLLISDTNIVSNGGQGIRVGLNGGDSFGTINRVVIQENGLHGITFFGNPQHTVFTITNSVLSNNAGDGVEFEGGTIQGALMLRDTVISNNKQVGVVAIGSTAFTRITRSTITGNGTGLQSISNGNIISFGDNSLAGNTTDGAPTTTIVLK